MKKCIMIIVLVFFNLLIFCAEVPDNTKTYNINITYGKVSGGVIGFGNIQQFEKRTKEVTYNFHYLRNSDYFVTGLYCQINTSK